MSGETERVWPAAVVAVGVALLAYGHTLAPDLTWANAATDGGELITASVTLGIPHPPGYPTYVLLGKLFSYLPFGSVAFRYNLFSAVCAAAAAGLLAAAIGHFWRPRVRPVVAVAAALTFAFAPLVWSQAVVAEVYALNLLMVAAFLLAWSRRGPSAAAGLLIGLAVTTHLTSLLLIPAALIGAGRRWPRLAAGFALGLLPLAALPWLARGQSPVVWGWPATPEGWWWLVSGQLYGANVQLPADGGRVLVLLRAVALGPLALLAGGVARPGAWRPMVTAVRAPVGLWGLTAGLYFLFALAYATPDAAVVLLPALLLLALLSAPLLARIGPWSLALPLALLVIGLSGQGQTNEAGPRAAAEAVLAATPPDAILLTPGDRTIFTLWYFQHVEGLRPDVRLADANLFAFDWYRARLAALAPDLGVPIEDDLTAFQRQNETGRPFCTVSLIAAPPPLPGGGRAGQPHAGLLCTEGTP